MAASQVDVDNRAGIGTALRHRPTHLILSPSKSLARRQPSPPPTAPPLPTLPDSKAKQRTSTRRSLEMSAFPLPLTAHNSLASFKAAHAPVASSSQGGCSSETHRTSSNVDLDFSYEAEFPPPPTAAELKEQFYHAGPLSSWQVEPRGGASDWVGIDMIPSAHDVPEAQLVRSSSGQLVDAKHSRASSAMDLRAQFRAAEIAAAQAQLTARAEAEEDEYGDAEFAQRRANVREGKRPVEGERAFLDTAPLPSTTRFETAIHSPAHDYDDDHRDGHVVLIPEMSPPRSAPPQFSASFASQQEQARARRMSIEARASKVYPLPLQLLQRNKYAEDAEVHLRLGRRRRGDVAPSESDFDSTSYGPSPLFGSDWEGTARTAPSTPNDTPVLKGSSDGDDDGKPVPHRMGASPGGPASAVGLGFDFGDGQPGASAVSHEEERDHFPLIPLRANRRLSLPPAPPPKDTTHRLIPSVSISPPPSTTIPEEDLPHGTSSSTLSQDSLVDATTSSTRGVSRRLSAVKPLPTSTRDGEEAGMSDLQEFVTPPSRPNSPNVRTPQHLLVTPTQNRFLNIRSPSFSFSPEPLRLVKVQLMRAAGYGLSTPQADAPTTEGMAHTAVAVQNVVKADTTPRASAWHSFIDFVTSSPVARLDEVVPAKLILFVSPTPPFAVSLVPAGKTLLTSLVLPAGRAFLGSVVLAHRRVVPPLARRRVPVHTRPAMPRTRLRLRSHYARQCASRPSRCRCGQERPERPGGRGALCRLGQVGLLQPSGGRIEWRHRHRSRGCRHLGRRNGIDSYISLSFSFWAPVDRTRPAHDHFPAEPYPAFHSTRITYPPLPLYALCH